MLDYGSGANLYWDALHEEVRFTVESGASRLLCRITREALDEHCGQPADGDAYVAAARAHFDHIGHRISDKLSLDLTEPDGSVLIGNRDW